MSSSPPSNARSGDAVPRAGSAWDTLVMTLFVVRFFLPTEATPQGHTIWLAAITFLLAGLRAWWLWKMETPFGWRLSRTDLAVALWVGGHLLAGSIALLGSADVRPTINCLWEWGALAVTYGLIRNRLRVMPLFRNWLAAAIVLAAVTMSALGIWQQAVWYPEQSRNLARLTELQSSVENGQSLSYEEAGERQQLIEIIGADFLAMDATARRLLADRVQGSVEPIGRFALTNTLAALLVAGLFLSWNSILPNSFGRVFRWRSLPMIAAACLVAYCLLLTKSRTAWIGSLIAGCWLAGKWFFIAERRRIFWRLAAGGILAVGLIVSIAWAAGGIDREVLSEATKSLSYRGEYWRGSLEVAAEHSFLGIGSGNFRNHYLQHKPPGSSEEIVEPHNLFLDVWVNGGLMALAGLLALMGDSFVGLRNSSLSLNEPAEPDSGGGILLASGCLGIAAIVAKEFLFDGLLDPVLLCLIPTWVLFTLLLVGSGTLRATSSATAVAALLALWVHLLGAGGIGMPAIQQLILTLALLSQSQLQTPTGQGVELTKPRGQRLRLAVAISQAAALVGCVLTAALPVVTSTVLLQQGNEAVLVTSRLSVAEKMFQLAVEADPWAAEPRHQMAALAHYQWQNSGLRNAQFFEAAIRNQQASIERDPHSSERYRVLGEWWQEHFLQSHHPEDAQKSLEAYRQASALYPHDARLQGELAVAQFFAGRDPSAAAQAALHLDDLNRQRGHVDKLLSEDVRSRLEEMLSIAAPDRQSPSVPMED